MAKIPAAAPDAALSAQLIISTGGWHPRHARVLLIEQDADAGLGLVLVDGNGDGAELELEYWQRGEAGQWQGGSTSGFGPLDRLQTVIWSAGPFVCAVGRTAPRETVRVGYHGRAHLRTATELGVWGFIHPADPDGPGGLPALTGPGGG
jgi:hypothetical protein